jgi:hypothetical protein
MLLSCSFVVLIEYGIAGKLSDFKEAYQKSCSTSLQEQSLFVRKDGYGGGIKE